MEKRERAPIDAHLKSRIQELIASQGGGHNPEIVEDIIANADDLCMYLLNKAHVSTVTGKAFGEPNCIRISFANSTENIEKGFAKIKAALAKLK